MSTQFASRPDPNFNAGVTSNHDEPYPYRSPAHIDEIREYLIDAYYDLMVAATIPAIQAHWCRLMCEQVRGRSAAVVERMEREMGLR